MTTTVQNIIDRAKSFNPLSANLASDTTEMCTRVQQMQQRLFTAVAKMRRPRFTTLEAVTSTNASGGRTFDLSTLSFPLERIMRVTLGATGAEIFQVSEHDVNARRPPRYFVRDQILTEVVSDWGPTGAIALNILHVYGAAGISPTGGTNQNVSVPDPWIDTLVLPLARYFHIKDPGRDPNEYQWLDQQYTECWYLFVTYLANLMGDLTRREELPGPPELGQRPGVS